MRTFCKNIWEFLKADFCLTFRHSLVLGIVYLCLIPVIGRVVDGGRMWYFG